MATYNSIPHSDIDGGSPIKTELMTWLRDNPTAIAEGATGAPRFQTDSFGSSVVTNEKIATETLTTSKFSWG